MRLLFFFFFFFLIIHSSPLQAKGGRFEANNVTNNNSLYVLSLYLRCIEFIFEKGILKLIQSFPRLLRMKRIMGDNRRGQVIPVPNPEILNCLKAKW